MPHDDSNKCKEDGVKNQQHVMAPTLNYYTNPWMWSKCSRKYITEFLEYVNPILHSTQSQDVVEPVILVWTPDVEPHMSQCQLAFVFF